MLDIQIVSDLHLEFYSDKQKFNFIKPTSGIIALLGDICCCGTDEDFEIFKRFITEIITHYRHIIFVPGNHEYYFNPVKKTGKPTIQNTINHIDAKIKAYFKQMNSVNCKLHYLNNASITIQDGKNTYLLVGSTLWSWIPENQRINIGKLMNDYRFIYTARPVQASTNGSSAGSAGSAGTTNTCLVEQITPSHVANMHLKCLRYIKTQILNGKKSNYKVIILTHHKPYKSLSYSENSIDVAYESDLSSLFVSPVVLWGYGHTHISDLKKISSVILYSNPKGYPNQRTNFKKDSSIKI